MIQPQDHMRLGQCTGHYPLVARVDNPNDWPIAQGAFRREFLEDPGGWPSVGVHVRWRTVTPILERRSYLRGLDLLPQLAAVWWRGWPEGTAMAVWFASDLPRTPARLLLTVDPGDLPAHAGEEDAELVGELTVNSALVVIGTRWRVFPTYPPIVPARHHIRR